MKVQVDLERNGHIFLNGQLIAILGQWNKFEDLDIPTKRKKGKNGNK